LKETAMELMILCAGAGAKDWAGSRAARPLRTRGKRQAQKIGAFLGRERLVPDTVLTDGSLRAVSSAQKALKAAGRTARGIEASDCLGRAALPDLAGRRRPLLVALPGTVRKLLTGLPADPPLPAGLADGLGPGSLLRLALENGAVRLLACVDAGDLPDLFPYPAPDGAERRERPAYY
jgi:phosphohistidine phosphatase